LESLSLCASPGELLIINLKTFRSSVGVGLVAPNVDTASPSTLSCAEEFVTVRKKSQEIVVGTNDARVCARRDG
jgi:hypothetical protein